MGVYLGYVFRQFFKFPKPIVYGNFKNQNFFRADNVPWNLS